MRILWLTAFLLSVMLGTLACKTPTSGVLENSIWKLQSYGNLGNLQTPLTDTVITAQFSKNGNISGTDGCNSYFETYQKDQKNSLKIGPLATTKKACLPPIADQEAKYLQIIQGAGSYTIANNELRVINDTNILVFMRNP